LTRQVDRDAELQAMVRAVVDGNRYMVLGTYGLDGLPRVSPVYFTHDRYHAFYWVSSPTAQHSRNVGVHPDVAIVVFDSSVVPGSTQAVYVQGVAELIPDAALEEHCAVAFRNVGEGARPFRAEELSGSAPLRLYRATAPDIVVGILGDRVKMWITLNEPFIHTVIGHGFGLHAPGQSLMLGALPTAHHQLLAHGLAVAALRGRMASPITLANNYSPVVVVGDDEEDRAAGELYDALHNRLFTDPLLGRGYPDGFDLPVRDGDLEIIAAPIDAIGVNYYNPTGIRRPSMPELGLPFDMVPLEGYPVTDFGWPVVPEGLGQVLTRLHRDYGLPLYVTESGCAYPESPDDQRRIDYLAAHIDVLESVRANGVDVRGYFVWSILDNFEWAEGFSKRFGLVHVDFGTLARTPKSSYGWLRGRIEQARR
jgi:nitroimidazol reductase NimA-like FMN-containing flavoprotein (pyridoxamine 5'-phosphate oxidase superfamily)